MCLNNSFQFFWKYMWVKKCVKIHVMLFKNWKHIFKFMYQTGPKFCCQMLSLLSLGYCQFVIVYWHLFVTNRYVFFSRVDLLEHPHQLVHKFFHFTRLKPIFSILYTYFYKTPTLICLLYTFIQIKYSFLCHIATDPHLQSTPVSHRNPHNPPVEN